MNHQPTPNPQHGPDKVDVLLGQFFKSQVPANLAKPPAVLTRATVSPKASVTHDAMLNGQWALVASVAMLLGGYWLISTQATNGKPRLNPSFDNTTANLKSIQNLSKKSN